MRFIPFLAVGFVLAYGVAFSQSVDEGTSVSHPYTSLTPGALRADPERTRALADAAAKGYQALLIVFETGNAPSDGIYPASKRWMELEVNLSKNKDEARKALADHASRMKALRKKVELLADAGLLAPGQHDLHFARYAAIEAEILLLNAGGKLDE